MAEAGAPGGTKAVAQVLEMMHPMREPPQPASLTPVLLTLAVGCGVALVALVLVVRARRRRAGLREAALAALARTSGMAPAERLAGQAALLRRLVRRIAGEDAARLQGAAWLATLDGVFATRFFTDGAGVAYGDALYGAKLPDVAALDAGLAGLFGTLRSHLSPLAGEGGAKRRMRGPRRLLGRGPAGGNDPSSDPASPGHPGSSPGQALLPQGEKG